MLLSSKQWPGGTHALRACLGTMSEIITDGETGLLLRDNSPGCIAEDIVDAVSNFRSKKIAINTQVSLELSRVQEEQDFGNAK